MKKKILAVALAFSPLLAFAQTGPGLQSQGLVNTIKGLTNVVNYAIPFFIAVAIVFFIIGVIRVILVKGDEERKNARGFLIWSIIGITVILGIFGISRLLINTFGITPNGVDPASLPTVTPAQPTYPGFGG